MNKGGLGKRILNGDLIPESNDFKRQKNSGGTFSDTLNSTGRSGTGTGTGTGANSTNDLNPDPIIQTQYPVQDNELEISEI